MRIVIPETDADAIQVFGGDDEHRCYALGVVPRALGIRLREIDQLLAPGAVLTLARDWERCIVATVTGDPRVDVLAFTEHGLVGHGGVNAPMYFSSFAALLAHEAATAHHG
jgi:hypothetical protein